MTDVKPSKQYRMMVVPYRPWLRFMRYFLLVALFLASIVGCFYWGAWYAAGDYSQTTLERDDATTGQALAQEKLLLLEQQRNNLSLGSEIDRKANEELRLTIVDLNNQIADLEQDNNFYRELMSPGPGDKGIVIDTPSVLNLGETNQYKYNFVVKQIAAQHQTVTGYLEFVLVGVQNDKEQRLSLMDLSDTVTVERLKLSFKYFQRFQGQMVLPDGFSPSGIELKVVSQRPKSVVIEKKFGWSVTKS